jgi:hypothetical protein
MLVGVVLMAYQRVTMPDFFRRGIEVVDPEVARFGAKVAEGPVTTPES